MSKFTLPHTTRMRVRRARLLKLERETFARCAETHSRLRNCTAFKPMVEKADREGLLRDK